LGVWSAELADGSAVRIGRTYLTRAKAMAGR
jgi:two-component system, LytTR family, response regulator AlgR